MSAEPAAPVAVRAGPGGRPLYLLAVVAGLCLGLPVAVIVVRSLLDGSLATASPTGSSSTP